ncbi:MAG TPA: thioredoxin domain-containing protein, partial [Polyangiaceae bacterium]|nr:thioredoxin domain-containing protein [Polyangiaceae bacterium]
MSEPHSPAAAAPRTPNRLALALSPYLRQHAHNPVDWHAWGPEALGLAKASARPILLSVGYSACHWCHVMERESFEDAAIAAKMNASFVCVKVDREERPDLDQIYQVAVQLLGRSGGWPLTVFLTPELEPFFGGTYFPPSDRHGLPGFSRVLDAIAEAYAEKHADLMEQARDLTAALRRVARPEIRPGEPPRDVVARAARRLATRFDAEHGGFGDRPKFPNTMPLEVLLRYGMTSADASAELRVGSALSAMRDGGVHDQLAGGFHRYSTDAAWRVPHFEKMLYDNALLLRLYTDAARALESADHEATARGIAGWLFAEMRSPDGGFYATQDADTEGEEGRYFVFSPADVRAAVKEPARAALAIEHFGVTEAGNFERTGKTVLSIQRSVARLAIDRGLAPSAVAETLAEAKAELLAARRERPRPHTDRKILTSWNALTISALAEAGAAFDEPTFVEAAERAFGLVERESVTWGSPARVARLVMDGAVGGAGFLDDYALLANAALDLYEVTGRPSYALAARDLVDGLLARFHDDEVGLVFTEAGADDLVVRAKDAHDGAVPSGTAMACRALLRLGAIMNP